MTRPAPPWPRNIVKNGSADLKIDGNVLSGRAKQIRDAKRLGYE